MRRFPLLGILLLLAACSSGGDPEPDDGPTSSTPAILLETDTPSPDPAEPLAGDHRLGATLPDGAEVEYLLHAPPAVERGRPLPLVLVFHGSPGSPEDMARLTRFDALADDEGFLVVYPSSVGDPEEVGALLDRLTDVWPVDTRRVYAAGFSRGASTTYVLAEDLSRRIAAFAPVSGIQYGDFAPRSPVSLITFQGGRDEFASAFPAVNRQWARGARCDQPSTTEVTVAGGPARRSVAQCAAGTEHVVYHVERMGHVWPREATRIIWEFFAAHPHSRALPPVSRSGRPAR
ncbi:alpha/beta hydrolase family esterase [Nocardioides antri]|uniref:Polyhydroxybutyrate depolymerase n=1 Tax=Nocardioides antri TaxID=2607659 RepID=A0A5B1M0R9_9ACTN|nr:PHB depolymerase family esterase [Nocardioides antri]KAA1425709.1 hypothetical protein F0U47_18170 [Nocardioides antri]